MEKHFGSFIFISQPHHHIIASHQRFGSDHTARAGRWQRSTKTTNQSAQPDHKPTGPGFDDRTFRAQPWTVLHFHPFSFGLVAAATV